MQHCHAIEAVDRSLQDILDNPRFFGGIPVVFGDDFLQTLPVVKRGYCSHTVHACLLSSPIWPMILPNILKLEQNMHLTNSVEDYLFAIWLIQLAHGELNDVNQDIILPPHLICPSNTVNELITLTYPALQECHNDAYFLERCILCPQNKDVRAINDDILDSFPGTVHELWSVDKALNPDNQQESDTTYCTLLNFYIPCLHPVIHRPT